MLSLERSLKQGDRFCYCSERKLNWKKTTEGIRTNILKLSKVTGAISPLTPNNGARSSSGKINMTTPSAVLLLNKVTWLG